MFVDLCSVFQAGAVGQALGPNLCRKPAKNKLKSEYIYIYIYVYIYRYVDRFCFIFVRFLFRVQVSFDFGPKRSYASRTPTGRAGRVRVVRGVGRPGGWGVCLVESHFACAVEMIAPTEYNQKNLFTGTQKSILGVLTAPGAPETARGASHPAFWSGFWAPPGPSRPQKLMIAGSRKNKSS